MITEDNIAAATLAKIFGGELLRVQENARTDSGSTPDVVKMHPKQFLVNQHQQNRPQQNSEILNVLQREAEMAYPLAEEPKLQTTQHTPPPAAVAQPLLTPPPTVPENNQPKYSTPTVFPSSTNGDVWERICFALEHIANKLDSLELTAKKTKQKRRSVRRSVHEANS